MQVYTVERVLVATNLRLNVHSQYLYQQLVFADPSVLLCRSGAGLGIRSLLICSFRKSNERLWAIRSDRSRQVSESERLWGNRSGCSYQKSDYERIAQVAHDKWTTVSDSLRSLMINEQMSDLLKKCWLKKSYFLVCFI